jgi:hypothetical protein
MLECRGATSVFDNVACGASLREDPYVFIHVPKTAGSSIRSLLAEVFSAGAVSPAFPVRRIDSRDSQLLQSYRVIAGHISWADAAFHFGRRRLFTFLRDPLERCLSVYGYFRQRTHDRLIPLSQIRGLNSPEEATSLARQLDPDDFFRSEHPHVRQNVENRMCWQLGYRAGIEFRRDMPSALVLQKAIQNLAAIWFVGFFESLGRDVANLLSAFGGKPENHQLPRINQTKAPLLASEIGSQTRKAIERLTDLDRRLYDHARKWAKLRE